MNDGDKDDISMAYEFAELRQTGGIYVDKTAYLHRLVTWGLKKLFFVSRPRRFGKSLMISTLEAIFRGRKDLFKGLYIAEQTDYDWPKVPVIRFSLAQVSDESVEQMEETLVQMLMESVPEAVLKGMPPIYRTSEAIFRYALMKMAELYGPVAVLIDEYDAPIGHALDNLELAEALRRKLAAFYHTLKTKEHCVRFMMMTGVSKFSRLSVFSGLNNLVDISMFPDYAAMLGYTEDELETCFRAHMEKHAAVMHRTPEAYRAELKYWFNGYRFSVSPVTVYNPFSIALTLTRKNEDFGLDWTQSGRPSMLMNFFRGNASALLEPLFGESLSASAALLDNTTDLKSISPLTMLYQTGYLTVCGKEPVTGNYLLQVPDEEVRRDLMGLYVDTAVSQGNSQWREGLVRHLVYDDPKGFTDGLKDVYAALNYGANEPDGQIPEYSYRRILHGILVSSNIPCAAEKTQSNRHRSDVIADLPTVVYIFELKQGGQDMTAAVALKQIRDKGYATPYLHSGKVIYLIGLAFDNVTHELKDVGIERPEPPAHCI